MKTIFSICAMIALAAAVSISASAQTSRPTPTPFPRPAATPLPRPAATPAGANTAVPQSRIALIDTSMFGDEKTGIYRYVDAARAVQNEFKSRTDEMQNLQTRLNALVNELNALMKVTPVDQKAVQAKQQQGESLQAEFNTRKAKLDEDIGKRIEQVVSPLSAQIGVAMDQFATQRGVTMTLDLSKLLPAILTAIPTIDLTQAFINDFNSKNPRTAAPPPRP
ncbi:MAG: OmpH family outer membrane protein [Pyrinomonadaceae bacterium]